VDHIDAEYRCNVLNRPRRLSDIQIKGWKNVGGRTCFHPRDDGRAGARHRIGRLEDERGQVARKVYDVLATAACNFQHLTLRWQDIAQDAQNGIAIARRGWRIQTMIGGVRHHCKVPDFLFRIE
jgi:hypothetical protein